jgi:hypothetical protein
MNAKDLTAAPSEINAARAWIDEYARSKRVLVAYHADPDGVVAAVLASDYLQQHSGASVTGIAVRTHEFDFRKLREHLRAASFDALVAVDINFASRTGFLSWLANGLAKPALIYDDHLASTHQTGSEDFLYINPMTSRRPELPVPACFFMYLVWSGKRDTELAGAKLPDIVDIGLFGESVLSEFKNRMGIAHAELDDLRHAANLIYALYAVVDWPTVDDPVFGRLSSLPVQSVDSRTIVRKIRELDRSLGNVSVRLNRTVRAATDLAIASAARFPFGGGEIVVGRVDAADFLIANLVASNMRNRLNKGVAIACQRLSDRTIVEMRRTRDLKDVELDAAVQKVSRMSGVVNSGGHPPAAGMAVESTHLDEVLSALRNELARR